MSWNKITNGSGTDGKSAYQIWLDQGNTGTVQQFLDSLKGVKGDTGSTVTTSGINPDGGLKQSVSLNTLTTFGVYRINGNCTDMPNVGGLWSNYLLVVEAANNGGYILQTMYSDRDLLGYPRVFRRYFEATWKEWEPVWNTKFRGNYTNKTIATDFKEEGIFELIQPMDAPFKNPRDNAILEVTKVLSTGVAKRVYNITNITNAGEHYIGTEVANATSIFWQKVITANDYPLYGKKIGICGDSLVTTAYLDGVKAVCQGATITSYSIGGSALGKKSYMPEWDAASLIERSKLTSTHALAVDIENLDYVLICAGTNDDTISDTAMGTVDSTDENSAGGALNNIIQNFISRNKSIKIVISTPPYRRDDVGTDKHTRVKAIGKLMEQIAAKYNLPSLNLWEKGGVNIYNESRFLGGDLLHHQIGGSDMLGRKVGNLILKNQ